MKTQSRLFTFLLALLIISGLFPAVSMATGGDTQLMSIANAVVRDPMAFYASEVIVTNITINGAYLTPDQEGDLTLEILLDQMLPVKTDGSELFTTTNFLDRADVPTGSATIAKSEVIRNNDEGTCILRVSLKNVDALTRLVIPFSFSFANRVTPADTTITPKYKLYKDESAVLSELTDKTHHIRLQDRVASKRMTKANPNDNQLVFAGATYVDKPTYLEHASLVPFYFNLSYLNSSASQFADHRKIRFITLVDTLPSYIDVNGVERTADFDPAKNPGWSLTTDQDGKPAVTMTVDLDEERANGYKSAIYNWEATDATNPLNDEKLLLLSFPDAPIKDGTVDHKFVNKVQMTAIPYNESPYEAEHRLVTTDDIMFRLTADVGQIGPGFFGKVSRLPHTINADRLALYLARPQYSFSVANPTGSDLGNIVILENPRVDKAERLFITKFILFGTGAQPSDFVSFTGIKKDGTRVNLPLNWDQKTLEVNQAAIAEINAIASQVQSGALTPGVDTIPAVSDNTVFMQIEIKMRDDFILGPGQAFAFYVDTAFVDPYNTPLPPNEPAQLDIANQAELSANLITPSKKILINPKSRANKMFVELIESMSLSKSTQQQTGDVPGKTLIYVGSISFNLSELRYVEKATFVDLLPVGVDPIRSPNGQYVIGNYPNSSPLIDYSSIKLVDNFNDTGRTAVIFSLNPGLVKDMKGGDGNNPNSWNFRIAARINNKILPREAEKNYLPSENGLDNNTNEVYFYFGDQDAPAKTFLIDEISLTNQPYNYVQDVYDVNENGSKTDYVLRARSMTPGKAPQEVRSVKLIRSTETDTAEYDYTKPWNRIGITTHHADTDQEILANPTTRGTFQYNLQVSNFTDAALAHLDIYDVLPFVGDHNLDTTARKSDFENTLQGPVSVLIGDLDKKTNFNVYYTTSARPLSQNITDLQALTWVPEADMAPEDYAFVTALHVVLKEGFELPAYSVVQVILDMKAPQHQPAIIRNRAAQGNNNFLASYDGGNKFAQSNTVYNRLLLDLPVQKVFKLGQQPYPVDEAGNGFPVSFTLHYTLNGVEDVYTDEKYPDGRITLFAENGYYDVYRDLPPFNADGTRISYRLMEDPIENYVTDYNEMDPEGILVTNTYIPPRGPVDASKTWDLSAADPDFPLVKEVNTWFKLYRDDGSGVEEVPLAEAPIMLLPAGQLTVQWMDQQLFNFDAVPYTFTVKEVDASGQPYAPVGFSKQEEGLVVTNTYLKPDPVTATIQATKKLVDLKLQKDMFEFELSWTDEDGVAQTQIVKNDGNGQVVFPAFTYTKPGRNEYTLKEVIDPASIITQDTNEYLVIVNVVHDFEKTNTLDARVAYYTKNLEKVTDTPTFVNKYIPPRGPVEVTKIWSLSLADPDFPLVKEVDTWFKLYRNDGNKVEEVPLAEAPILLLPAGELTAVWPKVQLYNLTAQPYTFFVKEVNATGEAAAPVGFVKTENGLTVENVYLPPPPVEAVVQAKKVLKNLKLQSEMFEFELSFVDEDGVTQTLTAKNDADGLITFPTLTFAKPGRNEYTLREIIGGKETITYDRTQYLVVINVVHDFEGTNTMEARVGYYTVNEEKIEEDIPNFTNLYTPPPPTTFPTVSVPLAVQKKLTNGSLKSGQFTFVLKDANGKVLAEATNDAKGQVVFPDRTFSREISNYLYTVSEVAGSDKKITYDKTVYTLKVSTTAKDGKLSARVDLLKDGQPYAGQMTFTNNRKAPSTGDQTLTAIFTLFALSCAAFLGAWALKRRKEQN